MKKLGRAQFVHKILHPYFVWFLVRGNYFKILFISTILKRDVNLVLFYLVLTQIPSQLKLFLHKRNPLQIVNTRG